jgi:uncharacterized protein YkwD
VGLGRLRHHRLRRSRLPGENTGPCAGASLVPDAANIGAVEHATLCLVNRERRAHGLPALVSDAALGRAATSYSAAMVRGGYFADVSPSGSTVLRRVRRAGYGRRGKRSGAASVTGVGENLAVGGGNLATPRSVVRTWMSSPPHRANILSPAFHASGIGVALGIPRSATHGWLGPGATYTQDLGTRR